jgi:hypothetical protein
MHEAGHGDTFRVSHTATERASGGWPCLPTLLRGFDAGSGGTDLSGLVGFATPLQGRPVLSNANTGATNRATVSRSRGRLPCDTGPSRRMQRSRRYAEKRPGPEAKGLDVTPCDWPEVVRMAIFDGCWTRASYTGEGGGFRGGESASRGGITIALQAADMPGWSQTGGPREAAERSR